ncbi:MAG: acyl-ACP thioesterase [Clostridiales bacterium]|nr:acyl-ACP thioesterase [Clostridiales bacterium]
MIYTKKGIVSGSLIDTSTNLSVIGTFQIVEDALTELMGELKIDGITAKKLYNAMWVYTKNRIKFFKPLAWGEGYTVESFVSLISLAKINIDTAIKDNDGNIVAYSKVELCALDLETGRIRKTATVGVDESIVKENSQIQIDFTKFAVLEMPKVESVVVRSTNIDFCHHCNNVEYLRFLLNTYSVAELENNPIKEFEICYANQSFEGDTLDIFKMQNQDKDILIIQKEDKVIIKCEILRV